MLAKEKGETIANRRGEEKSFICHDRYEVGAKAAKNASGFYFPPQLVPTEAQ